MDADHAIDGHFPAFWGFPLKLNRIEFAGCLVWGMTPRAATFQNRPRCILLAPDG
jgi:hypothetical protein